MDGLVLGIDDRSDLPIEADVATALGQGCPVYASVKADAYPRLGETLEIFCAVASNHYRIGVDGVQLLKMNALRDDVGFSPDGYGLGPDYDFQPLQEIGCSRTLRHRNKHYVLDNLGTASHTNGVVGGGRSSWTALPVVIIGAWPVLWDQIRVELYPL